MRSLENVSPLAALCFFSLAIGTVMFVKNPIIATVSLFFSVFYHFIRNGTKNMKSHVFSLIFFIVLTVLNPFFYHNGKTVLIIVGDMPVTLEALIYGASSAETVVAVIYWFRAFTSIMTEDKLLSLIGRVSPKFSLMLSTVLRFVPLFLRRAKECKSAQRVLGMYKEDNIIDSVRCGASVFSSVSGWALENGIVTADSMSARGYGAARRTSFSLYRSRGSDFILIAVIFALFAVTAAGILIGAKFEFYPAIISPVGAPNIISYVSYGLLCTVPSVCEIYEVSKWKYLESKI